MSLSPETQRRQKDAGLLDEIVIFLRRFVVLTDEQADVLAVWIVHTHCFRAAVTTPYIAITSPTMRAGKTRILEVAELLVARPWRAINATPAVLFHKASQGPTMLIDELDATTIPEHFRAVINSGYRQGGSVTRLERLGGLTFPTDYTTFCPKALAGIGSPLPATIMDRSVEIRVERRKPDEPVERFRARHVEPEAADLRNGLAGFAERHSDRLAKTEPAMPEALSDRQQDIWEPVFAIAHLLGDTWTNRVERAALDLCRQRHEPDPAIRILRDLKTIFDQRREQRIKTSTLLTAWQQLDEPDYTGPPLTPARLATRLHEFGISPKTIRLGQTTAKGYERARFEPVWARYLDPTSPSQPSQP